MGSFDSSSSWHFLRSLPAQVFTWVSMHSRIRVYHCCIPYLTAKLHLVYFRVRVFFFLLPPAVFLSQGLLGR